MSILTHIQPAVQPATFTLHPTVAQDGRTPVQRYRDGFDAYCRGLSLDELYDPHEIRGWWGANRASGEAVVAGYADSLGW